MTPKHKKPTKCKKVVKAWVWLGSHDKPMVFIGGAVPDMLRFIYAVYEDKVNDDLVPCEIHYQPPKKLK